jgi:hypothetical protein
MSFTALGEVCHIYDCMHVEAVFRRLRNCMVATKGITYYI